MADRVQGKISFTPIVTLAAGVNSDEEDTIQHDIKQALGGEMNVTARSAADKWYYAPNLIANTIGSPMIVYSGDGLTILTGASGNVNDPNEPGDSTPVFTDGVTIDHDDDRLRWIFIKNTGTSDIYGTKTTDSVYIRLGTSAAWNHGWNNEIPAGEAWMTRMNTGYTEPNDVYIETGQANGAGAGTGYVRCTVVAMIEDTSA